VTTRSLAHVETAPTFGPRRTPHQIGGFGPLRNRSDGNVCVLQLHVTLSVDAKDCIVYVEGQFFLVAESIPCLDADDVDSAGNSHRADASRRRIRGTEPDPDAAGFVRVMRRQRAGDAGDRSQRVCPRDHTTDELRSVEDRTGTDERPIYDAERRESAERLRPGARVDGRRDRPVRDGDIVDRSFTCGDQRGAAPAAVRLWVSERHCSCR